MTDGALELEALNQVDEIVSEEIDAVRHLLASGAFATDPHTLQ